MTNIEYNFSYCATFLKKHGNKYIRPLVRWTYHVPIDEIKGFGEFTEFREFIGEVRDFRSLEDYQRIRGIISNFLISNFVTFTYIDHFHKDGAPIIAFGVPSECATNLERVEYINYWDKCEQYPITHGFIPQLHDFIYHMVGKSMYRLILR